MSEAGRDLWNPGDQHQNKESPKRALTAPVAGSKLEPECLFPLTAPHYCIVLYCSVVPLTLYFCLIESLGEVVLF